MVSRDPVMVGVPLVPLRTRFYPRTMVRDPVGLDRRVTDVLRSVRIRVLSVDARRRDRDPRRRPTYDFSPAVAHPLQHVHDLFSASERLSS